MTVVDRQVGKRKAPREGRGRGEEKDAEDAKREEVKQSTAHCRNL